MNILQDILNVLRRGEVWTYSPIHRTQPLLVPGIGAASPYASGDAFGTQMTFSVPDEGTISNVVFLDYDDEGINKELVLFNKLVTETADNAEYAVADIDLTPCLGVCYINTWSNFANNQVGQAYPALSYVTMGEKIYGQLITRGADNIAAGLQPAIYLVVV